MIDIHLIRYYLRNKFWEIVHNCVALPLLPFAGEYGSRFHDWTIDVWNPPSEPAKSSE